MDDITYLTKKYIDNGNGIYFKHVAQIYVDKQYTIPKVGHVAVILIDNNNEGVLFSYAPKSNKRDSHFILRYIELFRGLTGRKGEMTILKLTSDNINKLLNNQQNSELETNTKLNLNKEDAFIKWKSLNKVKAIVYDLPYKQAGEKIFNKCIYLCQKTPRYVFFKTNCINVTKDILESGGIQIKFKFTPRRLNNNTIKRYYNKQLLVKCDKNTLYRAKRSPVYFNRFDNKLEKSDITFKKADKLSFEM